MIYSYFKMEEHLDNIHLANLKYTSPFQNKTSWRL